MNWTVTIGALIDANTIAGNYTDTLTFTVTGNF
jgi:spore coat protein U-like protein